MKTYNTRETQDISGVSWATISRWANLLEKAGFRFKTGEHRNAPILHSEEGVRFLMARQGGGGPSGVPQDPELVRRLFELYDEGLSTNEVAEEVGYRRLRVWVLAENCGVFNEIEEKEVENG